MNITLDITDSTFRVPFGDDTIRTTITFLGDVAADWIDETLDIHGGNLNNLLVGFDVKWRPYVYRLFATNIEYPAALLQLCVGNRCLIFQLLHADYIPPKLSQFLSDPQIHFFGVGVGNFAFKLQNEYRLLMGGARVVDLPNLAATKTGLPEMRHWGMRQLLGTFKHYRIVRLVEIERSDWSKVELDREQIKFATIDVVGALAVGQYLISV